MVFSRLQGIGFPNATAFRISTIPRLTRESRSTFGMGLMKCGGVVVPFDNTITKGTDLYNLYNTNIHEKIAMEKRGREM